MILSLICCFVFIAYKFNYFPKIFSIINTPVSSANDIEGNFNASLSSDGTTLTINAYHKNTTGFLIYNVYSTFTIKDINDVIVKTDNELISLSLGINQDVSKSFVIILDYPINVYKINMHTTYKIKR